MNIYEINDPEKGNERFVTLHQTPELKIEAIRSRLYSPGEIYDQREDEWVILIQGTAAMEIEGEKRLLNKGDSLYLKRRTRHRVLSTSDDALWLAVFSS